MTRARSPIEIGSYISFIWFSCFLNGVHCIFYCFAAFQNREALPVIVNGERDLLSHKTFSYKIKHKQLCHFFYNQTCFIIIIRFFEHLPWWQWIRARTVLLNIFNGGWFPSPSVINEKLRIDTERLIQHFLAVWHHREPCNISHREQAHSFQLSAVSTSDSPKIRKRSMTPQQFTVFHFIELRDTDAVLVSRYVFSYDVHRYFREIHIRSDSGSCRDTRSVKHLADHRHSKLVRGQLVCL